ncbi:LAGLIDADG family homing endonuclease [Halobellus limi]|nr:LAGLIDADG family homing endonuclease [Halobellus limi]SEG34834.1 hypothetical protein SAMN04488133_1969 [Halobellus limi]
MDDRKYSVEELVKAYMAGLVDGAGSFSVQVHKDTNYKSGYAFAAFFKMNHRQQEALVDFANWAEDQGVEVSVEGESSLTVGKIDDLKLLIETLRPFVRTKALDVEILAEEIIPRIEAGEHTSEDGLIELMGYVEQMPSVNMSNRKYTQDYFIEEFKEESA